jgi:hypothetical protein
MRAPLLPKLKFVRTALSVSGRSRARTPARLRYLKEHGADMSAAATFHIGYRRRNTVVPVTSGCNDGPIGRGIEGDMLKSGGPRTLRRSQQGSPFFGFWLPKNPYRSMICEGADC